MKCTTCEEHPSLVGVCEAARVLHCAPPAVYSFANYGKITEVVLACGHRRFDRASLIAKLARESVVSNYIDPIKAARELRMSLQQLRGHIISNNIDGIIDGKIALTQEQFELLKTKREDWFRRKRERQERLDNENQRRLYEEVYENSKNKKWVEIPIESTQRVCAWFDAHPSVDRSEMLERIYKGEVDWELMLES